jgi:hypothetical protein
VFLTRSPLSTRASPGFTFDLHVLSAPPAFVLSQDQTLHRDLGPLLEVAPTVQLLEGAPHGAGPQVPAFDLLAEPLTRVGNPRHLASWIGSVWVDRTGIVGCSGEPATNRERALTGFWHSLSRCQGATVRSVLTHHRGRRRTGQTPDSPGFVHLIRTAMGANHRGVRVNRTA